MRTVLSRRSALLGLTTAITLGRVSLAFATAATERRFVVVLLRGALDGMAAVAPYGDPALPGLRAELLPEMPGQPNGMFDLGGFFGMHPSLAELHAMYAANEALIVHAVAGPYRVRSHFEAQDYLESGADHRMTSGWLNRVAAALPSQSHVEALAVGISVPLLLRGPATVSTWAPHGVVMAHDDLYRQVATLNRSDRVLGPAIAEGLQARNFSDGIVTSADSRQGERFAFPALARAAGEMLGAADGPRIAALELGGWDTHLQQQQRLNGALKQLDSGLTALREGLGTAWKQTAVLVMTEFGRTARANGTHGTDHGTGTACFALGGAIAGGRVAGDWPGLAQGKLLEDRDLQPTTDLRAVAKALLRDHLGLSSEMLLRVFPGSESVTPMAGLVRT